MRLPDPPLLLITDRLQARMPLTDLVAEALAAGCRWVSLREKDLPEIERMDLLDRLVEAGGRYGATIGVHGGSDSVGTVPVDALHLPAGADPARARAGLGRPMLVGISTHAPEEVERAGRMGADYATYSPVFESLSKPGYGRGAHLRGLSDVVGLGILPIVALGGITAANARACMEAGAAGIAVMGAVMSASRPGEVISELIAAIR